MPILTDFTSEQVAVILDHSECRILFVSRRNLAKAGQAAEGRVLVALEDFRPISAPPGFSHAGLARRGADDGQPRPARGKSEDLAAIVYTSGTTGSPKGVMLSHLNIVHDGWSIRFIMLIGPEDRLLSVLPMAHTYEFTVGFIYPMMQGSSIHYLDRPPSSSALMPALMAIRPTTMLTVPLIIEKVYRSSVKPSLEKIPLYSMRASALFLERIAGAKLKRTFGGRLQDIRHRRRSTGRGRGGLSSPNPIPLRLGLRPHRDRPVGGRFGPQRFSRRHHRAGHPRLGYPHRGSQPGTGEGEIQIRGPERDGRLLQGPGPDGRGFHRVTAGFAQAISA